MRLIKLGLIVLVFFLVFLCFFQTLNISEKKVTDKNGVQVELSCVSFQNNGVVAEPVAFTVKNGGKKPIYFYPDCEKNIITGAEKRFLGYFWFNYYFNLANSCGEESVFEKLNPGEEKRFFWSQEYGEEAKLAGSGIYRLVFRYLLFKPQRKSTREKIKIYSPVFKIERGKAGLENSEIICGSASGILTTEEKKVLEVACQNRLFANYKEELTEKYCYEYLIFPYLENPENRQASQAGLYLFQKNVQESCFNAIQYNMEKSDLVYEVSLGNALGDGCLEAQGKKGGVPSVKVLLGYLEEGKDYELKIRTCGVTDSYKLGFNQEGLRLEEVEVQAGRIDPERSGLYEF